MKQSNRLISRFVLLACLTLLFPDSVTAAGIWKLDTTSLTNAVKSFLVGKRGGTLDVARLVDDPDPAVTRGMAKLLAAAGVTPGTAKHKGIPYGIANGMGRLINRYGDQRAKEFLKEIDELYDWAKATDDALIAAGRRAEAVNMQMLGKISKDFGSANYGNWKGAWFELKLASYYARQMPSSLLRLQPQIPPPKLDFRDAKVEFNGADAFVEAKDWTGSARNASLHDLAESKLTSQMDSHFSRLKNRPDLVGFPPNGTSPNIPPGLKLVYDFNEELPTQWKKALKDKAKLSLQQHFGVDEQTAKNWVSQHLHFRVCSGIPFNCRQAP